MAPSHRKRALLWDVCVLAFTAFGGPAAHLAMFFERLVNKRKYLSADELIELNSLCSILPGPTSTQTLVAVAYRLAGTWVAVLSLFLWLLPATLLMTFLAIGFRFGSFWFHDLSFLQFLPSVAVGFIFFAGIKMIQKVVKGRLSWVLLMMSILVSCALVFTFQRTFWTAMAFPILLIVGGLIHAKFTPQPTPTGEPEGFKWNWKPLVLWLVSYVVVASLAFFLDLTLLDLAEKMFRSGSFVFGGGQVLIPLLENEVVTGSQYLTHDEFLQGVAVVQVAPGPLFGISAFIGAMAFSAQGVFLMVIGGVMAAMSLFFPGLLLVFFAADNWQRLKGRPFIKCALPGVNSVATGFVCSAGIVLFFSLNPFEGASFSLPKAPILLVPMTVFLLLKKVPGPWIVLLALGAGIAEALFL